MNNNYFSGFRVRHFILALSGAMTLLFSSGTFSAENAASPGVSNITDTAARRYYRVPDVVPEQSSVIYSYPAEIKAGPVNIYIDKEFHTVLHPGEFTTFCIASGVHTLIAADNDAPHYKRKENPDLQANFKGGKTYFITAAWDKGHIISQPVLRRSAEMNLGRMLRQNLTVSRASVVEECRYVGENQTVVTKGIALVREPFYFSFAGKTYEQLLPESQERLNFIVAELKKLENIEAIEIAGFTDGIGSYANNMKLSEVRAQAIRNVLVQAGISAERIKAEGNGISSTSKGCIKSKASQNEGCHQAGRRVELMIKGH